MKRMLETHETVSGEHKLGQAPNYLGKELCCPDEYSQKLLLVRENTFFFHCDLCKISLFTLM